MASKTFLRLSLILLFAFIEHAHSTDGLLEPDDREDERLLRATSPTMEMIPLDNNDVEGHLVLDFAGNENVENLAPAHSIKLTDLEAHPPLLNMLCRIAPKEVKLLSYTSRRMWNAINRAAGDAFDGPVLEAMTRLEDNIRKFPKVLRRQIADDIQILRRHLNFPCIVSGPTKDRIIYVLEGLSYMRHTTFRFFPSILIYKDIRHLPKPDYLTENPLSHWEVFRTVMRGFNQDILLLLPRFMATVPYLMGATANMFYLWNSPFVNAVAKHCLVIVHDDSSTGAIDDFINLWLQIPDQTYMRVKEYPLVCAVMSLIPHVCIVLINQYMSPLPIFKSADLIQPSLEDIGRRINRAEESNVLLELDRFIEDTVRRGSRYFPTFSTLRDITKRSLDGADGVDLTERDIQNFAIMKQLLKIYSRFPSALFSCSWSYWRKLDNIPNLPEVSVQISWLTKTKLLLRDPITLAIALPPLAIGTYIMGQKIFGDGVWQIAADGLGAGLTGPAYNATFADKPFCCLQDLFHNWKNCPRPIYHDMGTELYVRGSYTLVETWPQFFAIRLYWYVGILLTLSFLLG